MIVDLAEGALWALVVTYDTEQDTLLTRTRDEYGGQEPEYWRPHPCHPGLLVGYVRDVHEVEDEYDDAARFESYDKTVALKLLRASQEIPWSAERSTELHQMNTGFYYHGVPDMGHVHEMHHAIARLVEWLDARQLSFDFGR